MMMMTSLIQWINEFIGIDNGIWILLIGLITYILFIRQSSNTNTKILDDVKKPASSLHDIEDLVGKSIIPLTLKQMKNDGIKPLSMQDKVDKINDLESIEEIPKFVGFIRKRNLALARKETVVFQMNIGYYCNQACTHCHVDSSPLRKDMMSKEIAEKCMDIIRNSPSVKVVDLTGGAPELNRQFKYLVQESYKLNLQIIDRCNLTVLLEPHQADLPNFLAQHKVKVIASLPCYLEDNVDKQRGDQIFMRSIKGLQMLNKVGYGMPGTDLTLNLVYNPTGLHLPPSKDKLEKDYKRELRARYGIEFTSLICITNMPINRYYDHLKADGNVEKYMHILVDNFNDVSCQSVMCQTYLSVDPAGEIFDCDFNQQMDLGFKHTPEKKKITVFDIQSTSDMLSTPIITRKHCYGCTAGSGSSCGAI